MLEGFIKKGCVLMSKKRLFNWAVVLLFVLSALFITGCVGKADMPAVYISNNSSFLQKHASDELSRYAEAMTSKALIITTASQGDVNDNGFVICPVSGIETIVSNKEIINKIKSKLGKHNDSYVILSGANGTVYLVGRTDIGCLYAVYDYLSSVCGCGFFQDGEFVPQLKELPTKDIELVREPRFDKRLHFAWNAHKAIKKYHSFWWSAEEWEKEFDWTVKQRMNMLRIDMFHYSRFAGDAFRQVFPEIGPEPEGLTESGFWFSCWGWPPEYRRELTQRIFKYGRKLGIKFIYRIAYAEIPLRFKKLHPEIKYDPDNNYGEAATISPEDPQMMEIGKKSISKLIELYGTDHMYLETPYVEHTVAGGIDENMRLRILAAKKFLKMIKEVDPQAEWVTDTWDAVHHWEGLWAPERAKTYFDNFANDAVYIYETAGDMEVPPLYESYDGFYGKKWAFGVLQSFAGDDGLHGDPVDVIDRIKTAATYENCDGVFMIPELTHQTIMYWDLISYLAWNPKDVNYYDYLKDFARRRYGSDNAAPMVDVWQKVTYAVLQYGSEKKDAYWHGPIAHYRGQNPYYQWNYEGFGNPNGFPLFTDRQHLLKLDKHLPSARKQVVLLKDALDLMLSQRGKNADNSLYTEDLVAIYRSYTGKLFNLQSATAFYAFSNSDKANFEKYRDRSMAILDAIADVLSGCPSYSINKTIKEATSVPGHNKRLAEIIRHATIQSDYTSNDVYEQFGGYYIPRMRAYFELLDKKLAAGDTTVTKADMTDKLQEISHNYQLNGWTSSAKPAEPVLAVAKHFKQTTGWTDDKQSLIIEACFWKENQPDNQENENSFDFTPPDRDTDEE
ncbi:MAG: alpha-N-acetylglucosaminidase TIM-barrel domain-containing protein [Bacteroidota bacterium]|nr:alpha-N-acetylglucosaminidase TIM-barrel domain-containing protein [Bacteroidota bacterium]